MTNRNPYENGVDIPDFVEKNDDIDMSVFRMDTEETPKNNVDFEYEDDDDYDDEPRRNLSGKGVTVIVGIIAVILLIAAVAGWIFGISKNNAYKKIEADYQTVTKQLTEANNNVSNLQAQISQLNDQITALQNAQTQSSSSDKTGGTPYKMVVGVKVRTGAGTKYSCVSEDKVSDDVAEMCDFNGDVTTIREGSIVSVYEAKTEDGSTWGRIDDGAWVCLSGDGETYAVKQ